jgi:hypothetical protein
MVHPGLQLSFEMQLPKPLNLSVQKPTISTVISVSHWLQLRFSVLERPWRRTIYHIKYSKGNGSTGCSWGEHREERELIDDGYAKSADGDQVLSPWLGRKTRMRDGIVERSF